METLTDALVIATLLGTGLVAGIFFAFSNFVMRALGDIDAQAGMHAMQAINVTVLNRSFLALFVGTAPLTLATVALALLARLDARALLCIAGCLLYVVGTFIVTVRGNVPWNERLAQADAAEADGRELWQHYLTRWTFWNHVRTAASAAATLCYAGALVLA